MANRFRWLALCLMPALLAAGAAFAQQAPLDLRAPGAAAEKSAKAAKTPAAATLTAAEAVSRANAWLDAARVMSAEFVQIGPDGRRSQGELSVVRPGRMRFEYTQPARFEIVADGRSVAVIDRKLDTQDEYFIGQTPLKFLLADHIDIAHDTRVLSVADEGNAVTIEIEDRAALGGTAHLTLVFDASTFALRRWTVIGEKKLERRLGDEILVLGVELAVDDGDAAAVGNDLEARRLGVFEPHPARTLDAEFALGAPAVGAGLNEVGSYDPRLIEPGVGARHSFGGRQRRRSGLCRLGGLCRRRGR